MSAAAFPTTSNPISSNEHDTNDFGLTRFNLLKLDTETVDDALLKHTSPRPLNLTTLAAAISRGCSAEAVKHYLDSYPQDHIKHFVKQLIHGKHPLLFYAAERNNPDIIQVLLDRGANADGEDVEALPVLAYAIIRSKWTVLDPLEVVKTLLAHGAKPQVIPQDMWVDYTRVPSPLLKHKTATGKNKSITIWCTDYHRRLLTETLHLSLRYFLYRASQLRPTLTRGTQLAVAHNYVALLKVPYMMIGQQYACRLVVEQISSHIGLNTNSPLVLTFAGLSGHGKTELATKMGQLLNVAITNIDCAQMRTDQALFGARMGFSNDENGSQLNNFLADNEGKRCVVFLDEFDKTTQEVHNSLLLILDSGDYHDRRKNVHIDCTKTIWILATNLGDKDIAKFYDEKMQGLTDEKKLQVSFPTLISSLKRRFRYGFNAPMTGRMKNVAPFYPFDINEQAVIAHKFLLDFARDRRQPIDISPATRHYPGHIHLAIKNDGPLCLHIAKEAYVSELGARSLKSAVDDVRRAFYCSFINTDRLITNSMNDEALVKYNVQLQPMPGGSSEVAVFEDGVTRYHCFQRSISTKPFLVDMMQVDKDCDDMPQAMGSMKFGERGDDDEQDFAEEDEDV